MKNQKKNKNNGNKKKLAGVSKYVKDYVLARSLPGTSYAIETYTSDSVLRTTTVTSGLLTVKDLCLANDFASFVTDWSTYSEFVIPKIVWKIRPITQSTGITLVFASLEEDLTPTIQEARKAYPKLEITNTGYFQGEYSVPYYPTSIDELQWLDISDNAFNPFQARFYMYTDAANYGAPIVATALFLTYFEITLVLRGRS